MYDCTMIVANLTKLKRSGLAYMQNGLAIVHCTFNSGEHVA